MKRFKNYGLWVAIVSLALVILLNTGVISAEELGRYEAYVEYVLNVLVLLGILSNPKEGKGFLDLNKNGIEDRLE